MCIDIDDATRKARNLSEDATEIATDTPTESAVLLATYGIMDFSGVSAIYNAIRNITDSK